MSALDTLENLLSTKIVSYDLRYCLVDNNKVPYKLDGTLARPNHEEDFVSIEEIANANHIDEYRGIGISIKASKICAIDVDHCFSIPFDFGSIDDRGRTIFHMFEKLAYIEFSFSGQGMRILFKQPEIENYATKYYIKNTKNQVEYYQPTGNARYVTVTGKVLCNNDLENKEFTNVITEFLDKFMKRPICENKVVALNEDLEIDDLLKKVRSLYLRNILFQDVWFNEKHELKNGQSQESDRDFYILSFLYQNVITDKIKLRLVFEQSPFFKSKDKKHINKWIYGNYRYYDYMYDRLGGQNNG